MEARRDKAPRKNLPPDSRGKTPSLVSTGRHSFPEPPDGPASGKTTAGRVGKRKTLEREGTGVSWGGGAGLLLVFSLGHPCGRSLWVNSPENVLSTDTWVLPPGTYFPEMGLGLQNLLKSSLASLKCGQGDKRHLELVCLASLCVED